MLNAASLNAVNSSKFSQRFVKPLFDSYCFSNLPQTIESLLTGQMKSSLPLDVFTGIPTKYNKVILFFIDGFGWRFFERGADKYPFLKTLLTHGVVSKMTSQFPSTTAAHVTSIHTGLNVAQSGIYEWTYYEPLIDDMISPLLFSYAGDKERDTLKRSTIPAEAFYPRQTFYQTLKTVGVQSYIFQSEAYTPSTYSDIVYRGATVIAYKTLAEALIRLSELLLAPKTSRSYYFLYLDKIDAVCHHYGPDSRQFQEAIDTFFTIMEHLFYKKTSGKIRDTLFMMTADHGQVEVNPKTTCYLNKHTAGIEQYLRTNLKGKLLVPAGSARDMFLHVKDECTDEATIFLQKHLEGRAEVYKTQELLAQGFFGSQAPSIEFLSRVGNLVILPYQNETVWWYEEGKFDMHFLGHHGGLTPEEMEIPLFLLPL
jgi:hypothetical protein